MHCKYVRHLLCKNTAFPFIKTLKKYLFIDCSLLFSISQSLFRIANTFYSVNIRIA